MSASNLPSFWRVLLLSAALPVLPCLAQSVSVDVNSPEGKQMTLIEHETDAARKQTMLEEFVQTYASKPISGWAYAQLQGIYLQQQQYEKALAAGSQALVVDPNNLEAAYGSLKSAEAKSDPALIAKWAAETGRIAHAAAATSPAGDASAKARADYAKQVETYSEYAVYSAVLKTNDPAQIIMLVESLEQRSPQSSYLSQSYGRYLNALRQSGQPEKAAQAAEKQIARDPANEDALLVAAGYYMQQNQNAKAVDYASKLVTLMNGKQRPDNADADWQKRHNSTLGLGYWIEGVSSANSKEYAKADQSLRSALPLIKDNPEVLAIGLFHLGVADYQLGKIKRSRALLQDALKYSQQSAALKSPLQQQAQGNVAAIRRQLGTATSARAR
jgi:tetratricopeptide (TPR) repeat protein